MVTINFQKNYVRNAIYLVLLGALFTTVALTIFHAMQDDAFLIDLAMPPILAVFLLICLIYLYKHPENTRSVVQGLVIVAGILICAPAWYFSILASASPDITLLETMPPITPILLPVAIAMVMFLQPRTAIVMVSVMWVAFIAPILGYFLYHPHEMMNLRGIEILVASVPAMFMVMALMLIDHGLKKEVSRLLTERSDLKELAERDSLTGLLNRRAGEDLLSNSIDLTNSRFGIIMFDIDHFKNINDTYGHDMGDAVLREIVRRCEIRIRARDLFVRWGGEEFLVFIMDAGIKETEKVAEQLRLIISGKPMESDLAVTASFGVTIYNKIDSPESLFKRADEALYEAKSSGRDQVVVRK